MTDQSSLPPTRPAHGKRIFRTCFTLFAILVIVLVVAGYILLDYSPIPAAPTYPLDIAQIRQLAQGDASLLPVRLNVLSLGQGDMPQFMVLAGGGLKTIPMPVPVFQVVYPDHTVMVDTGMDQTSFNQMFGSVPFSAASYDQLQSAMRSCQTILLTHEHLDHIAGLSTSSYLDELLPRLLLSREQYDTILRDKTLTSEQLANLTPLVYDRYQTVAPGMVLVKAAGHSPGSQMVYLRLQNGSEFLIVGDVVWSMDSLTRLKGRPLFMSLVIREDLPAIRDQARSLHDLTQSQPVHLLISHDYLLIHDTIQQGLVGSSLE